MRRGLCDTGSGRETSYAGGVSFGKSLTNPFRVGKNSAFGGAIIGDKIALDSHAPSERKHIPFALAQSRTGRVVIGRCTAR